MTIFGFPTLDTVERKKRSVVDVRRIDPAIGDYVVDDSYESLPFERMSALRQRVVLALGTRKGRISADPEFGNDTLNMRKIPANIDVIVRQNVDNALAALIREGSVEVVDVTVRTEGGYLDYTVLWRDVSSAQTFSETVAS